MKWSARLLTAAVLIALAAYAWRGIYTRYITDDYCTAADIRQRGFLDAMQNHREHWSGRFSYYAIKGSLESIGPATAPIVPGLMIVALVACATLALRRTEYALLAGCCFAFAVIDASPDVLAIGGPLVWETGVITYTLPLVLITAWLAFFGGKRWLLGAVILFIAGGLSETSLAAQCAFTGMLWVVTLILRAREESRMAAAGFVASLAALVVMATAPGNLVRMSEVPRQVSLPDAILAAPRLAYDYLGSHAFIDGEALLLVIVAGALVGRSVPVKGALAVAAAALAAYVVSFIPAAWALSGSPPPRALHVSNYFFAMMLFALAATIRHTRFMTPILLLSIVIPLHSTVNVLRTIPEGRRNAAEVEAIARVMRANRGKDVVLQSKWALDSRVLVSDPSHWTNRCMCRYYGVRSLRVSRW